MKKIILFAAVALLGVAHVQAQMSRLVGLTKARFNGIDFSTVGDSSWYMYSGVHDTTPTGSSLAWDSSYTLTYLPGYTTGNYSYRYVQTLDAAGNSATITSQIYDTPAVSWRNYRYQTNTYNAANYLTLRIIQAWDTVSLGWVNREKDSAAYDGSDNRIYQRQWAWDTTALVWNNVSDVLTTFSTANKPLTITRRSWNAISMVFVNQTMTTDSYNSSNQLTMSVVQNWDTTTGIWKNNTADTFLYDGAGNVQNDTHMRWDTATTSWLNLNENLYTYDAAHNMKSDTTLNWNNGAGAFVYSRLKCYTYNTYNQVLTYTTESWNNTTMSWYYRYTGPANAVDAEYRYYYQYVPPTGVQQEGNTVSGLNIFPVPAANVLTVSLQMEKAAAMTVVIRNMSGQIVKQWTDKNIQTTHSSTVSIAGLPPGTYMLSTGNGDTQVSRTFVIIQ